MKTTLDILCKRIPELVSCLNDDSISEIESAMEDWFNYKSNNPWVDITLNLPEKRGYYIVCDSGVDGLLKVCLAYYESLPGYQKWKTPFSSFNPTHWCQLVMPPKNKDYGKRG